MSNFLLLMKPLGRDSVGLGEYQFATVPRVGEYINHIVHEEFDKDETPVAKGDDMGEGKRRRIYRVAAVVHFTEPLARKDADPAVDGYLNVVNAGSSKKFNRLRHTSFFSWLVR